MSTQTRAETTGAATAAPTIAEIGPPVGLPEAPASVTVRVNWRGHDVMLTLRDHDGRAVLARLDGALTWLELKGAKPANGQPQATTATHTGDGPTCPTHGRPMKQGKGGGWYCPAKVAADDGTGRPIYCKQRAERAA